MLDITMASSKFLNKFIDNLNEEDDNLDENLFQTQSFNTEYLKRLSEQEIKLQEQVIRSDTRIAAVETDVGALQRDNIRKDLLLEQAQEKINQLQTNMNYLQPIIDATKDIPADLLQALVRSNYYSQMKTLIAFYHRFTTLTPTVFRDWGDLVIDVNGITILDANGQPKYQTIHGKIEDYKIYSVLFRKLMKLYGSGDSVDIQVNKARDILEAYDPEYEYKRLSNGQQFLTHRVWKYPAKLMERIVIADNSKRITRQAQQILYSKCQERIQPASSSAPVSSAQVSKTQTADTISEVSNTTNSISEVSSMIKLLTEINGKITVKCTCVNLS